MTASALAALWGHASSDWLDAQADLHEELAADHRQWLEDTAELEAADEWADAQAARCGAKEAGA